MSSFQIRHGPQRRCGCERDGRKHRIGARNIERGLTPHDATVQAMREVSGPIIAIALVLCAVFVPLAFVPGLSGRFYQQFAVTIAISTVISAFNSLTLSPALAAILLRPHDAPKDALTRGMDKVFGGFFRWRC